MRIANKNLGITLVILTSITYCAYRIYTIGQDYSLLNAVTFACEASVLALVSIEAILMGVSSNQNHRRQDAKILLESAKNILFASDSMGVQERDGNATVATRTSIATSSYESAPVDVVVFAEDVSEHELRRCFLSLNLADEIDHVYVLSQGDHARLCDEFGHKAIRSLTELSALTANVLVCRGSDIIYPDACKISQTYDTNKHTFLELRNVFSEEKALGEHGLVSGYHKRQAIKTALSTKGLAPWSGGAAFVPSSAISNAAKSQCVREFFAQCEKNAMHSMITQEITSEEISHEQTVSEIDRRGRELSYIARCFANKYIKGSKQIGWAIRVWSAMLNIATVRRLLTFGLIIGFVLIPKKFDFVTTTYVAIGISALAMVGIGSYLAGDRRALVARLRDFYFDLEASCYNGYKYAINRELRISGKSPVKKLPVTSSLLIFADAILVYRVFNQVNVVDFDLSQWTKSISLFAGYLLIVSALIGLGMVVVRQSRLSTRREISRGANLGTEPVSVVDLSPGGAGCISVTALKIGQTITFETSLPLGTNTRRIKCNARVKSCMSWNGSYRIGLEFIELDQEQLDVLETYCSVVFPHAQAREYVDKELERGDKSQKLNGKAEKRFLSYAASFVALGSIIYSNLSTWL